MAQTDVYTLRLAAPAEQQTFRLVELPPELLSIVENECADLSLTFKGKQSDDAVLCSTSATYSLKAVLVSNSFLIVRPVGANGQHEHSEHPLLEITGQVKDIIEVSRAVPKLERLNGLLKGSEWSADDEDTLEERSSKRRRYTYEQVSGMIQASTEELGEGLRQTHVLRVNDELRPLAPSQLSSILEAILTSIVARSFSHKHVPLEEFLDAVEEDHELPRDVVRGVLAWYGDVSEQRWRADMASLVCEIGRGLLLENRDNLMTEVDFISEWERKVGDSFASEISMTLLDGYLLRPLPGSKNVTYFPHTALPTAPAARFADLFLARPRWMTEELEPFLRGLPGGESKTVRDALLVKFARRSEGNDGTVWWSARANYT